MHRDALFLWLFKSQGWVDVEMSELCVVVSVRIVASKDHGARHPLPSAGMPGMCISYMAQKIPERHTCFHFEMNAAFFIFSFVNSG